jgi:hypothetical protein
VNREQKNASNSSNQQINHLNLNLNLNLYLVAWCPDAAGQDLHFVPTDYGLRVPHLHFFKAEAGEAGCGFLVPGSWFLPKNKKIPLLDRRGPPTECQRGVVDDKGA